VSSEWTIVGGGAIGGTLGHALARAGHRVTIVDTDAEHVRAVADGGLRILRGESLDIVPVAAVWTPDDAPASLRDLTNVILATKSQHTADAAAWIAPRLADEGFVLSAQNGLNEPVVAEFTGPDRVIGAFINIFADYWAPGVIRDGGRGAVVLGMGSVVRSVLDAAEDLRAYGPVGVTGNLLGYRWSKRAFAAILALTSVVDAPMASVIDSARDLAFAVACEITSVALSRGIALETFDAYEPYAFAPFASARVRERSLDRLVAWLATMPKDRSGVFRDIAVRRRPVETPSRPSELDVAGPIGTRVARQLAEIQSGSRDFGWHNLDDLRATSALRAASFVPRDDGRMV
jgi:2-dehydropantoate 2-reductase